MFVDVFGVDVCVIWFMFNIFLIVCKGVIGFVVGMVVIVDDFVFVCCLF